MSREVGGRLRAAGRGALRGWEARARGEGRAGPGRLGLRGPGASGLTFSHQQDPHVFLHVGGSQGPGSARTHGADTSRRERPPRGAALPALRVPPASLPRRPARSSAGARRAASSAASPLGSRDSSSSASSGSAGGGADGAPRGTSAFRTRTLSGPERRPPASGQPQPHPSPSRPVGGPRIPPGTGDLSGRSASLTPFILQNWGRRRYLSKVT